MLQRNSLRIYRKIFVLVALAAAAIFFSKPAPVRADACFACDDQNYYCVLSCSGYSGSYYDACVTACGGAQTSCQSTCLTNLNGYHFYEADLNIEQEIRLCTQMGHRAGYRRCMAGDPLYPDDYNACIPGASADDCCNAQEWRYDWENCW